MGLLGEARRGPRRGVPGARRDSLGASPAPVGGRCRRQRPLGGALRGRRGRRAGAGHKEMAVVDDEPPSSPARPRRGRPSPTRTLGRPGQRGGQPRQRPHTPLRSLGRRGCSIPSAAATDATAPPSDGIRKSPPARMCGQASNRRASRWAVPAEMRPSKTDRSRQERVSCSRARSVQGRTNDRSTSAPRPPVFPSFLPSTAPLRFCNGLPCNAVKIT